MRRTDSLPVALLGFLALVVVTPIWLEYAGGFQPAKPEDAFLSLLILPGVIGLFIASWVSPEFAGVVLGILVIVGTMAMAPWWFEFIGMASGLLVDDPLAQLLIQLAVPVLILTFLYQLGRRRLAE